MTNVATDNDQLATFGGPCAVRTPAPHFRWPLIGSREIQSVVDQLQKGEVSYPRCTGIIETLERRFAEYHGVPFAITSHSGTGALQAAFFALDLEHGDEVLAPAYTHLATVIPMLHLGLIPVLCEVEPETANIDAADLERHLTDRTRAIVVTHQYGHICDMGTIGRFARKYNLRVIEDCSHAHGSRYEGRLAGTFGDIACFSLQGHKTIVAGEGGILITRDRDLYERASMLGHFRGGQDITRNRYRPFVATGYGLKHRLHPLGAALVLPQLERIEETIANRKANLDYFAERLERIAGFRPLPTRPGYDRGGAFRFLVHYSSQALHGLPIDAFVEAVRAEGVLEICGGWLAQPLHLYEIFQTVDDGMFRGGWPRRGAHVSHARVYGRGSFPQAEAFSQGTLQFPAFTEPSVGLIDEYCEAIRKVARHARELNARRKNEER